MCTPVQAYTSPQPCNFYGEACSMYIEENEVLGSQAEDCEACGQVR